MSKESGIPTFRDALEGLWAKYDPEELATPEAFRRNPDLVWAWYIERSEKLRTVQPHPGHYAIAELEQLVPEVVVLTQNVDGLHLRAGSSDVVELHGNLERFKCAADCRGRPTVIDLSTIPYSKDHAPPCPYCGALVRPDVVWFGEMLPPQAVDRAFEVARRCQVMLVVGTSGVVQPAASLPIEARQAGATVIEVNLAPSFITPAAHIFLQGTAGEVLPRLVAALRARQEESP
jgi:NAD-dependent deacetylase